ncbi:MAG: prepilin peptidase [Pseudomonadota bacterium]
MFWLAIIHLTVAGAAVGSFLAVMAIRWPAGIAFAGGRSRCDRCAGRIWVRDLLPVFGYLLRLGRCRHCGARIDPVHIIAEIGGAGIGFAVGWFTNEPIDLLWAPFGWTLLALALIDARAHWLPDRLAIPLASVGLLAGIARGEASLALAGGAIGWAVLVVIGGLYERLRGRAGLGGGDPKLLGAIGAWLGPGALPLVILFACAAGLLTALAGVAAGRRLSGQTRLPFGTMLAAGTVLYFAGVTLFGLPAFAIPF